MNKLHYKDYIGNVFFSEEDGVFHGKVIGISDSISFEGESVKSLTEDFHNSIDEYLEFCKEIEKEPQKCSFSVDISPELYSMAEFYAIQKKLPLKDFIESAIRTNILT